MTDSPQPRRATTGPIQYKGEPLEAERGPGLGCFRIQLILLAILVVLTPVSVVLGWPDQVNAALLFITLILLLFTGQTIIFLLRLVAAERRGRRRPLAARTLTVGQLEDADDATAATADTAALHDDAQAHDDEAAAPDDEAGAPADDAAPDDEAGAPRAADADNPRP